MANQTIASHPIQNILPSRITPNSNSAKSSLMCQGKLLYLMDWFHTVKPFAFIHIISFISLIVTVRLLPFQPQFLETKCTESMHRCIMVICTTFQALLW